MMCWIVQFQVLQRPSPFLSSTRPYLNSENPLVHSLPCAHQRRLPAISLRLSLHAISKRLRRFGFPLPKLFARTSRRPEAVLSRPIIVLCRFSTIVFQKKSSCLGTLKSRLTNVSAGAATCA